MAVGGFSEILGWVEKKAPLRRNVEGKDVGDAATFLLSNLAAGITGQTLHVDCGYSTMGL
jgi:enoyl-[acyl-carrier protein] reductase I